MCVCVRACVCVCSGGGELLLVVVVVVVFLGGGIRRLESNDFQESKADKVKSTLLIRFQVPMLSPSVFRPSIGTSW